MKYSYILLIILISCHPEKGDKLTTESTTNESTNKWDLPNIFSSKDTVSCVDDTMPEFDEVIVSLVDQEGNSYKDTVINRIEKRRNIFSPCRIYVYMATFIGNDDLVISKKIVTMMATGRRWDIQPEIQDEVYVTYDYRKEDIEEINKYQVNKIIANRPWRPNTTTGIIEN
tara:strand:+ start:14027 stop:14539 length:513 start_codon:yes stop_codon:yes gene_type:complete